jgi:ABC-type uncharacterized transport system permease subunit
MIAGAGGNRTTSALAEAWLIAVALLIAMAAGSVLIIAIGASPLEVYGALLGRTLGETYGFGQVLFKATPLIFTGLAVALAFRVGLFNIGAEGQMIGASFATAMVGTTLPVDTPWPVAVPVCLVAGAATGAALGAIPGALRAWRGAHEVINTIMLNFIVTALVLWAGGAGAFVGATTSTAAVVDGATLPTLGFDGSAASASFFLALLAALGVWFFFARTRAGFRWRAVGGNPGAAENAGIHVKRTLFWAMTASGALAGLAASNWVLGYKHHFEEGIGRNAGFMGIAVALLGRNHPLGVVAAALLFGVLSEGGLAVSELVPKELVDVLQAVIILAVAATVPAARDLLGRLRPAARAPEPEREPELEDAR